MVHVAQKPRERRRAANVRRILDAAMDLATTSGFEALSMKKLADACDYTPGALYRYFDSKDLLLSALLNRVLEEVRLGLESQLGNVPAEEPLTRIFVITRGYWRFSVEQPHKFSLIAMAFGSPHMLFGTQESAEPIVRGMVDTMSPIGAALTVAGSAGILSEGPVIERTLVLFGATQGVLQMHKQARLAPALIDVEALCAATTRSLLMGWGADAAAVSSAHESALAVVGRPGGLS